MSTGNAEPAKTCESGDTILAATTIKQAEDAFEDMFQRLDMERTCTRMLNDKLAVLRTDNKRLRREVAAKPHLRSKVDDLSSANADLRTKLGNLRAERDRLAATAVEVASLTLQNDALQAETTRLSEALTAELMAQNSLLRELAGLRGDFDDIAGKLLETATALRAAKATITTLPSLDEMAQRTAEIGAARNEVQRLTDEHNAIRRELASAAVALETVTQARPGRTGSADKVAAQSASLALLDPGLELVSSETSLTSHAQPSPRQVSARAGGEPSFFVQLGAFRSKSGALSKIGRLQVVFPDNMDLAALILSSGEASDGSSVFCIMTDPMQVAEAERLCSPVVGRHGQLLAENRSLRR